MIGEFKDGLRSFKVIFNKIKELKLLREQEINEIKNETKRKLNMLDDEIKDILEQLDVNLRTLELRCIFCEKPHDFEKKRELRISAKERINEIKRLTEEAENNKDKLLDYLLDGENNFFKLLNDLEYEKNDALHNIIVLESKLIKLEISPEQTDRIENLILQS